MVTAALVRGALCALQAGVLLLAGAVVRAEMPLPTWSIGDWWKIEETVDIEVHAAGFQEGTWIVLQDLTKYEIVDIGPRTQPRRGKTYDVYVMDFDGRGAMSAEGIFKMIGLSYEVRVVDGSHTGEQWNRTADMSLVMTHRRLSGILEGKGADGVWRPFGPFEIQLWEEYDPPILYGYPLEVGKHFDYALDAELYGTYSLDFAGLHIENEFGKSQRWEMSCDVPSLEAQNGCQFAEPSYYIDAVHSQDGEPARQQGWIEPRIKWYNRVEISRLSHPLGTVRSAQLCLTDADVSYTPPTPGPGEIQVSLLLNQDLFRAADPFDLRADLVNTGPEQAIDLYVVLDLGSLGLPEPYYFWPSWVHYPEGIDHRSLVLAPGEHIEPVVSFTWPEGAGAAQDVAFLAAAVDPETASLLGDVARVTFGFQ
jgi:hypothetical protein